MVRTFPNSPSTLCHDEISTQFDTDGTRMEHQDRSRQRSKMRLHPVAWIVTLVSVVSIVKSGPASLLPDSWGDEVACVTNSSRIVYLDGPFDATWGRRLSTFPTQRTDDTQVYDQVDSEDTPDMERAEDSLSNLTDCRPHPWQRLMFPTCNEIHAMDMSSDLLLHNRTWILSTKGYWRYAWQYHQTSSNNALVLKTFRLEHSLEEAYLEYQRIDALVMERFTSMPSILDIFSYCGLSVLTEYADRSLSRVVDKLKTSPVKLLKLAKKVTNGVVALHHAGVVHNDLNPGNLAYSDDKQVPILFDFNLAVLLRTENNNHTCPFVSKYTNPQWRAPEEQEIGTHLTAKTDVYALGNVLFRFATGDSPWGRGRKTPEEKDFIMERKLQGYYPPFSTSKLSLAGHHLVEIMKQCYQVHPKHRPSARRVVAMLNMAIHNLTATELP